MRNNPEAAQNPIAWYYLCLVRFYRLGVFFAAIDGALQGIIFVVFAGTVFNAIHTPPPFYISPYEFLSFEYLRLIRPAVGLAK